MKKIAFSFIMIAIAAMFAFPAHASLYLGEYYYLESAIDSRLVIDVSGGSRSNRANIQLYEKNGTDAQLFKIIRKSNGYFTIINKGSKKAIDVDNAGTYNGCNVQQYQNNNTRAQEFRLKKPAGYPDGYLSFQSRCSGKYLDVSGGIGRSSQNIQIWERNGSKAQVFRFVPYVKTVYKTISLGKFNTVDEWRKQMQIAQMKAIGLKSYSYDMNGSLRNYGQIIVGCQYLKYKTIKTSIIECFRKKTITLKLPSKVRFRLHKHSINQRVIFDFQNLTLSQWCECGENHLYQVEFPWPSDGFFNDRAKYRSK